MFRKCLSIILCMAIALSVFAVIPFSVSAEEVDLAETGLISESQFITKINELKVKYPEKSSPNYTYREGWDRSWTCMGFADNLAYYCFGSTQWTSGGGWNKSWDHSSFNAGDCVRVDGDGHSIFITYVNGSTIKYAEGNYTWEKEGYYSAVRWDVETTLSALQNRFTYKWHLNGNILTGMGVPKPSNPWIKVSKTSVPTGTSVSFTFGATGATGYTIGIDKNGSRIITEGVSSGKTYTFNDEGNYTAFVSCRNSAGYVDSSKVSFSVFAPVILGNDFVANITNSKGALNLCANSDNNVFVKTKDDSDDQKWRFERQSDNSYKITNVAHEKCMDVSGANAASGTNIQLWAENTSNAQRFYIRDAGYGYALVPMVNTDLAVDIANGITNGSNVQDYTWNGSNAQVFSIDYVGLKPKIYRDYNGHTYEFYDIQVPWNQAYRFCENKGGHLVTISDEAENFAVYELCGGSVGVIWIGATDFSSEGKWYWVTGEPFNYDAWNSGEPNNTSGIEHYGIMFIDNGTLGDTGTVRKWNDTSVKFSAATTYKVGFVCEYDNDDVDADSYTPTAEVSIDGYTFSVYDDAVDWQTAAAICEAKGGQLVKIDSSKKNDIITQVIAKGGKSEYWINAADRLSEGTWTDSEGKPLSYFNWVDGNPDNDFNAEQYAMISKGTGKWGDLKGFSPMYRGTGFICESEDPTKPQPSEDGWIYCDILPSYVNPDDYTVEYDNYYEKQQKDSPGAGWVKAEMIKNEWVNSGSQYSRSEELSTSDARVLVGTSYYHYCGSGAPSGYSNYALDSTYVHYDSVPNNMIGSRKYLDNDNGHWYYELRDKSGNVIWCQSGVTCDGAWGTHGKRSSAWYATFTYQDRVKVEIYKYTKDSGWTDTADNSATSTKIRYKKNVVPPEKIDISDAVIYLEVGQSYQLNAFLSPDGADDTITWSTSDSNIVTVSDTGLVTAHGKGYGYITAKTSNDLEVTCIAVISEAKNSILGDVDGDESVTIIDTTAIQRHLASVPTAVYNEEAADVDCDGDVTIADATYIQRYLAQLPTLAKGIGEPIK